MRSYLLETEEVNQEKLEAFLDEACFLKGYRHANILTTIGVVWREGDRPKVVLPYMELGDLCSLVRRPDRVRKKPNIKGIRRVSF